MIALFAPKEIARQKRNFFFLAVNYYSALRTRGFVGFPPFQQLDGLAFFGRPSPAGLAGRLLIVAARIAEQFHLTNGYQLITKVGKDGGQLVRHIHIHLLGGIKLK